MMTECIPLNSKFKLATKTMSYTPTKCQMAMKALEQILVSIDKSCPLESVDFTITIRGIGVQRAKKLYRHQIPMALPKHLDNSHPQSREASPWQQLAIPLCA